MLINTALKQATELDATKSYAGALYQYLLAVGYYGMLMLFHRIPPSRPR